MSLYLLSDICLLADVFETFRSNSLEEYQLDLAYYVSAPQLAWNALLKFINRSIPIITDPEMYRMIQPNIRGGICHASVRYARANNKLMGSLYDPTKPTSFIMEVDANNLYGWAMSQAMPDGDFEWLSDVECREMKHRLINVVERYEIFGQNRSYIFEVDFDYPQELHELDDDYPMALELMTIEAEITGEKQHDLRAQYFGAACPFTRKLVCSFLPKKHYVVLGQLLALYLDRGMSLINVHRAIRFSPSPYVAGFIANNTAKRQQYKHDDVKKSFYKLMNNAPYGKTIENVASRSDIRLLNDMEKARKLAEKPLCVDFRVFDCDLKQLPNEIEEQHQALVGIEMRKLNHFINKPFANGFCVLEWSKLKMYATILFITLKLIYYWFVFTGTPFTRFSKIPSETKSVCCIRTPTRSSYTSSWITWRRRLMRAHNSVMRLTLVRSSKLTSLSSAVQEPMFTAAKSATLRMRQKAIRLSRSLHYDRRCTRSPYAAQPNTHNV